MKVLVIYDGMGKVLTALYGAGEQPAELHSTVVDLPDTIEAQTTAPQLIEARVAELVGPAEPEEAGESGAPVGTE